MCIVVQVDDTPVSHGQQPTYYNTGLQESLPHQTAASGKAVSNKVMLQDITEINTKELVCHIKKRP